MNVNQPPLGTMPGAAGAWGGGINPGARMGSSSGGRYMGRSFDTENLQSFNGIAPTAPTAKARVAPVMRNYNPAQRDVALRSLASAPAPAQAPAAKPPGANAQAAGTYGAEWDRLDRSGR